MADQKQTPEFSTEYPTPQVPTLPEYFRADSLDGVLPGEVVFPYGSTAIKADKATGALFISGRTELDQDTVEPRYGIEGSRVGIVRIHEQIDDEVIDGFIADCRYLKPGSITPQTILSDESDSDLDKKIVEGSNDRERLKPLLGAVFLDPDGKPHFSGDENLQNHIVSLMEAVDAQVAKSKIPTETKTAAEPELAKKAIGPDYYHG